MIKHSMAHQKQPGRMDHTSLCGLQALPPVLLTLQVAVSALLNCTTSMPLRAPIKLINTDVRSTAMLVAFFPPKGTA
jgi:hypothetical protein